MMKFIKLVLLLHLVISGFSINAQNPMFSIGADVSFSLTPVKEHDDYDWNVASYTGNFSPSVSVGYGDRFSGYFRSSYIRNRFENSGFSHVNGGEASSYFTTDVHQIYFDLLFQYNFQGRTGMYLHAGPSMGIPVHIKMSIDEYFHGYQDLEKHTYKVLKADYFADFQCVIGYGAKIPVNGNNLIRIENNLRIGILKIPVQVYYSLTNGSESRTIAIQFILGYIRTSP